jgi:hypothetical protein
LGNAKISDLFLGLAPRNAKDRLEHNSKKKTIINLLKTVVENPKPQDCSYTLNSHFCGFSLSPHAADPDWLGREATVTPSAT